MDSDYYLVKLKKATMLWYGMYCIAKRLSNSKAYYRKIALFALKNYIFDRHLIIKLDPV